ncbi:MAG: type II secretion system F family protein [Candidatus Micrarchaeia archaeon]
MKKSKVADAIYELVGRMLGRDRIRSIARMLDMAGINVVPEMFAGFVITTTLVLAVSAYMVVHGIFPQYDIVAGFIVLIGLPLLIYSLIMLRTDARRVEVENALPDFLQLAASNVRAGMPIDRALWFAARPEFGLLSREVEIVAKRTFGGEPFAQSLQRLSTRFQSRILERTVNLIIDGMASGGEMAEILERTALDIREMQLLRKDISAMMVMYVIFILFASVIGAPILYALSYQLIRIIDFIWGQILLQNPRGLPAVGMVFLTPSKPGVSGDDFFIFAIISSCITMVFAALIIASITTGNKRNGIKYIPIFIIAGLIIFFLVTVIFSYMFSGMLVST